MKKIYFFPKFFEKIKKNIIEDQKKFDFEKAFKFWQEKKNRIYFKL